MKRILIAAFFILTALVSKAQMVINDPNAAIRSAKGFQSIHVSGGIDLYLSKGDEAIAVSAKDVEARNHIRTEVTNGVLRIWYAWKKGNNIFTGNNKMLRAYVSYRTLHALSASGGCDVITDGAIESKDFILEISGGSDFTGSIQSFNLKVDASGGSDVVMKGTATNLALNASGGSDVEGFDMMTETTSVAASGGSDVHITVAKNLNVEASGGSDVVYKGNAILNKNNSSGSSSIRRSGN